jgi:phage anti-repressor protein
MIKVNNNNRVNARDVYNFVGVKTRFNDWIKNSLYFVGAIEKIDFYYFSSKSTGGRPAIDYELTLKCAKEICLVQPNEKSKELRLWLIELSEKRETLEHITVKEAALAIKVINCLKYIDKQKECFVEHKNHYIEGRKDENYIYQEFAKYRAKIVGWDKDKIDNALNNFLIEHVGYNRTKILTMSMSDKMSVMDIGEAIKIAVLDILYSKDTDSKLAQNFSNLCKKLAKEMQVQPEKTNQKNLFRDKEIIEDVKKIELK